MTIDSLPDSIKNSLPVQDGFGNCGNSDDMSHPTYQATFGNGSNCGESTQNNQWQCHPAMEDDVDPTCIFKESLLDALKKLPHLTKEDAALVDLFHMLDKVQAPLYLFDQIVSFMEMHIGSTFKPGNCIDRQEALLNKLMRRFT